MNKKISIEFDKDVWMFIVQKMLASKIPALEMTAKTIVKLVVIQENLNDIKEKANI